MFISMHLRAAAGVCALSTGLLIAGPAVAIAAADTGSDTAPSNATPANGTSTPRGPLGSLTDSLGKALQDTALTVQGVTGTLTSLGKSGPQPSSAVKPPKMNFSGTPTVHGSSGADLPAADEPVAPDTTAAEPIANEPTAAEPTPNDGAAPAVPQQNVVTPPASTFPASAPAIPVLPDVVAPVSNMFGAVFNSVAAVPALLTSLPTSTTPVSDVIGSLQALLTSVVNAGTPLTQLPTDLSSMLGVGTTIPAANTGVGTDGIGSSADADPATPMPIPATTTLLPGLPGFGVAPPPEVLGGPPTLLDVKTTGSSTDVTASGTAPVAPPAGASVLSIVERVIGAVVATVSVTALLAMALPGILGLLGTCFAGVRIGYRQAKAGSELPATAIARFVGSGPVGVVRSGSQISLRPRVVRPRPLRARTPHAEPPARTSTLQLLDRAV